MVVGAHGEHMDFVTGNVAVERRHDEGHATTHHQLMEEVAVLEQASALPLVTRNLVQVQ